ncbi:MAG TPA: hypothetical protein PLO78_03020 [Candidatus Omnitrophota bacterium]|nr:hypothetical protein [Candidatus Omnitrophota bacterium]
MKKLKVWLALVICTCLLVPQVFAKDIWELASSETYKEKTGGMFVRGLINAATSPVDILVQTVDKTKSGPPLIGTLTGMAGGLGCTALRAGSGIVDVALFWVPDFNGFPVNKSYHNCLCDQPEVSQPVQYAQQPVQYVSPVTTPTTMISEPIPQKPIVTVAAEPEPATPQHVVKKHTAYDYVKK